MGAQTANGSFSLSPAFIRSLDRLWGHQSNPYKVCLRRADQSRPPACPRRLHIREHIPFQQCTQFISLNLYWSRKRFAFKSLTWTEQLQWTFSDIPEKLPDIYSPLPLEGFNTALIPHLSTSFTRGVKGPLLLPILWVWQEWTGDQNCS